MIFERIAEDNPGAAQGVVAFLVEMGDLLDVFPGARGKPISGTETREIVDRRWKRYALRFAIADDGTVVIVEARRIRPFPPRYFVP